MSVFYSAERQQTPETQSALESINEEIRSGIMFLAVGRSITRDGTANRVYFMFHS
jgi:hypothetical protein